MLIGLVIIASIALLLTGIGFVVMRRRQPLLPERKSGDSQTVNIQRHNETGTDWRYRP
jgi:hypothetical protein